jgi:hypothetical protein
LTLFLKNTLLTIILIELSSNQELANLSCLCMPNQFGCKPNRRTIQSKFWKDNGYNPNNMTLPIFWSCPWFGHAKNLVGLVGAQTKRTRSQSTTSVVSEGATKNWKPPFSKSGVGTDFAWIHTILNTFFSLLVEDLRCQQS